MTILSSSKPSIVIFFVGNEKAVDKMIDDNICQILTIDGGDMEILDIKDYEVIFLDYHLSDNHKPVQAVPTCI